MLIDQVRLVAFDAVGTLLVPEPSVAQAYWMIAKKYGCQLSQADIRLRFQTAMQARPAGEVNEITEKNFWRSTVASVLGAVEQEDQCFEEIYNHFAKPEHWRVVEGAISLLENLNRSGIKTCIASNFDHRLRAILQGLSGLSTISEILISTEMGVRKPQPEFFELISAKFGIPLSEILMVGDEFSLDIEPAQHAGMQTYHVRSVSSGIPSSSHSGTLLSLWGILNCHG